MCCITSISIALDPPVGLTSSPLSQPPLGPPSSLAYSSFAHQPPTHLSPPASLPVRRLDLVPYCPVNYTNNNNWVVVFDD